MIHRRKALAIAIALSVAGLATTAHAAYYVVHDTWHFKPSALEHVDAASNKITIITACYGFDWLLSSTRLALDCDFTIGVSYPPRSADTDSRVTGGHEHGYHTRPLIYRHRHFRPTSLGPKPVYDGPGKLEYAFDQDSANKSVVGHTVINDGFMTEALTDYPLPEVSGEVAMTITLTLPLRAYGWRWFFHPDRKHIYRSVHYIDAIYIGDRGLVKVPDPGPDDHYEKVRSPDKNHPNAVAYYIKPEHLPQLYKLANKYYKKTKRVLSLNDMTLPYGGLFDIHGNWKTPHKSHRDGTDADVNRQGSNPTSIDCADSRYLIKAAQSVMPYLRNKFGTGGNTDSAILCEDHGKKIHIDFER